MGVCMKPYWYRFSRVKFGNSPWRLLDSPVIVQGADLKEAETAMADLVLHLNPSVHTLANYPEVPQGPYGDEPLARQAAENHYARLNKSKLVMA